MLWRACRQASTKEGTTKEETRLAGDMQELKMLVTALASNALKAQQSQQPSPDAPAFSRPAPRTNGRPSLATWQHLRLGAVEASQRAT